MQVIYKVGSEMRRRTQKDSQSGEIVIEATFVVTICIFIIFTMISMGMYLYQQAVVRIAAEQTAADMAMAYPHLDKEPYYNYTNYYDFMDDHTYRNTFYSLKMRNINKDKACWYTYGVLSRMTLREDEYQNADVNVKIEKAGVIERYVVVEISQDYAMPLSGSVFSFLGVPDSMPISAAASARVVDMSDMMSSYNFVITNATKLEDALSGKLFSAVTKWLDFVKKIMKW